MTIDRDKEYQLIKRRIYKNRVPFTGPSVQNGDKPNVLIIFTEGFSARTTSIYGKKFGDLTPNLQEFADHSLVVENYFNHTAATMRGLLGQNCSLFPQFDSMSYMRNEVGKIRYRCIPQSFNEAGYDTSFLNPHPRPDTKTDELMAEIGYGTVLSGEELSSRYLNNEPLVVRNSANDHQMYRALYAYLAEKFADQRANHRPIMLAMYTFETHMNVDTEKDGIGYGDRSNNALNTIANVDHAFGEFWEEFQKFPEARNTVIVFTADHAHYMERSYVDAVAGPDYHEYFIDQIPLIIHDPRQELPQRYDGGIATSLDFAPTVLHFLGFPNGENPFLGESIFDRTSDQRTSAIASYGDAYFLIDHQGVSLNTVDARQGFEFRLAKAVVALVHDAEVRDRIWNVPSLAFGNNNTIGNGMNKGTRHP
jgi:phosphoglycerol transferase MdoB-like AlkP superfamily enzyme